MDKGIGLSREVHLIGKSLLQAKVGLMLEVVSGGRGLMEEGLL